mgnify:CR=1 FL=1
MKGLGHLVLGCIAGGLLGAAVFFAVDALIPTPADAHDLKNQSTTVDLIGPELNDG